MARILRPCSEPGCTLLTDSGGCESHRLKRRCEYDEQRGTAAARGYDATWRRLRHAKLVADPFCQIQTHCPGFIATEVDHKIPIKDWPEGRLEWDNIQSTCHPCHSAKTMRERRERGTR